MYFSKTIFHFKIPSLRFDFFLVETLIKYWVCFLVFQFFTSYFNNLNRQSFVCHQTTCIQLEANKAEKRRCWPISISLSKPYQNLSVYLYIYLGRCEIEARVLSDLLTASIQAMSSCHPGVYILHFSFFLLVYVLPPSPFPTTSPLEFL